MTAIQPRAEGDDGDGEVAGGEAFPPREDEYRSSNDPLHLGNVPSDLDDSQYPTLLAPRGNRIIHHSSHSRLLCIHHQQVTQVDSSCEGRTRGGEGRGIAKAMNRMSFICCVCFYFLSFTHLSTLNESSVSIERNRGDSSFSWFEHFPYVLERENRLYLRAD